MNKVIIVICACHLRLTHSLAVLPSDDLINGGDLTRLLVQPAGAVLVPPPRSGYKCVEEEHYFKCVSLEKLLAEDFIVLTRASLRWSCLCFRFRGECNICRRGQSRTINSKCLSSFGVCAQT